jgi:hypothetical protein
LFCRFAHGLINGKTETERPGVIGNIADFYHHRGLSPR